MKIIRSSEFVAARAWGAIEVASMDGITTRVHWTDQPYQWHINDGQEVFAVLDGTVDMFYRQGSVEKSVLLQAGDVFFADVGCEHLAYPRGAARILMVEKEGSA